jgi:hypothetical protein
MTPDREAIEAEILSRVGERGTGKAICPSEVARALAEQESEWRALMPEVRAAAATLTRKGHLVVTQKGERVDIETATGPVHLGLPPH